MNSDRDASVIDFEYCLLEISSLIESKENLKVVMVELLGWSLEEIEDEDLEGEYLIVEIQEGLLNPQWSFSKMVEYDSFFSVEEFLTFIEK